MKQNENKIVLLLSGGIDSATLCALAKSRGYYVHALTFDYAQTNSFEIGIAKSIADKLNVAQFDVQRISISRIESDYIPARNIVFLAIGVSVAIKTQSTEVWIGSCASDIMPDSQQSFLTSFEKAIQKGIKEKIKIVAPFIRLNKSEVIRTCFRLGLDPSELSSCYYPNEKGEACGKCGACLARKKGFLEAGIEDKTVYQEGQ